MVCKRANDKYQLGVWHVIGHAIKGHICPASQIASHMQVNPIIRKGLLLMSHATTGNF